MKVAIPDPAAGEPRHAGSKRRGVSGDLAAPLKKQSMLPWNPPGVTPKVAIMESQAEVSDDEATPAAVASRAAECTEPICPRRAWIFLRGDAVNIFPRDHCQSVGPSVTRISASSAHSGELLSSHVLRIGTEALDGLLGCCARRWQGAGGLRTVCPEPILCPLMYDKPIPFRSVLDIKHGTPL